MFERAPERVRVFARRLRARGEQRRQHPDAGPTGAHGPPPHGRTLPWSAPLSPHALTATP
jgi:hypothetical protein